MPFIPSILPPAQATPQSWCFAFVGNQLLLPEDEGLALQPLVAAAMMAEASASHYLGTLAAIDCWALLLPAVPAGWRAVPLRTAMMRFDAAMGALAGRAAQLLEWDRSHRFCGVCGTPTGLQAGERARVCPACKHSAYPRLSPAMMALVWRPGELLLARSPHYAKGMFSALAGFVEAGESLEDCVHREVAEEVGLQIQGLRYYGSQSWPFPNSLMVAYTAEYMSGEIVPQPGEIEDAQWFAIDALPGIPPRFSIAGHLIRDTIDAMRAGTFRSTR
ncbi:MAG: NAD(+) diphosphatase [Betaproteobacteria bacterium]|nr:NAD(+) diphosphatase [Betaproteobacteria bacterium]